MRAQLCVALGAGLGLLCPSHAGARPNGIVTGDCTGCHGASAAAVLDVSASPASFQPGDEVTFSVSVRAEQGAAADAGVFVGWPSRGELFTLPGAGLTLIDGAGLVHSQPMAAQGGVATFRFGYRAPPEPGGVTLEVAALAGNGDGRATGDAPGQTRILQAFGCNGVTLWADLDRDGYGSEGYDESIGCEGADPPEGFAVAAGDCNENAPEINPGAPELCNRKDDDCDGEIDEDSTPVELFPDPDGDGYYGRDAGESVMGCVGVTGYAPSAGDCRPTDPAVSPGATEICNGMDDDCDGQADERVLPQCGVGACRRESYSCDPADCTPGLPQPERCNYRDDDCNGEIDDGTPCPEGSACFEGKCVTLELGTGGSAGTSTTAGLGGASGGGLGGAGGISAGGSTPSGGAIENGGAGSVASASGSSAQEPVVPSGCSVRPPGTRSSRCASVLGVLTFALLAHRARRVTRSASARRTA